MNYFNYEVILKVGDMVVFETSNPRSVIQPNFSHYDINSPIKREVIKGEVTFISGETYQVFTGDRVYSCRKNILKPLARDGSIVFFELSKKKTSLQKFYEEKEINDAKKDYLLGKINHSLICFVSGFIVCFLIFWILGFVK